MNATIWAGLRPSRSVNERPALAWRPGRCSKPARLTNSGSGATSSGTSHGIDDVVVGVTKINPRYIALTGLTVQWDYGVATTAIPAAQLDLMIRKVTDQKNPDHRFAIARFYLQAGFYDESGKEFASIAKDFPELAPRVEDARKESFRTTNTASSCRSWRRKAAGQHELAHAFALAVPQNEASATVLARRA